MSAAITMVESLGEWIKDDSILKGTLLGLQNARDADGNLIEVSSSACITAYEEFVVTSNALDASQMMDLYTAARASKGQGEGTDLGFMVNNFGVYQQVLVAGFDFYNECNLDYYMVAVGTNVQSPSGLANLGMNLYWRYTDEEDTTIPDLATATAAWVLDSSSTSKAITLGQQCGQLIRLVLQVEIPTTSDTEVAYY